MAKKGKKKNISPSAFVVVGSGIQELGSGMEKN
jgi:hypothetical protein